MTSITNRGTTRRGRAALSAAVVCVITAVLPGAASAEPADAGGVRGTGVERASVAADGTQANDESTGASITPDGRLIAFSSYANNLAPGDTGRTEDVFVRESATGQNRRFGGDSLGPPMLSSDGTYVARLAYVMNHMTFYQYEVDMGWRMSYGCSLNSCEASAGAGRNRAYSVTPRYPHTNKRIEVLDPATGAMQTIDIVHNLAPSRPSLSGNGRFLAYQDGGQQDVLLWDRTDNTVHGPVEGPDRAAELVQISDDGSKVVYLSGPDTYVHDTATGTAHQVPGVRALAIDPTGRYLLHTPPGTTGPAPLTLRDLATGTDETVTDKPATAGVETVSAGGRHVVFQSAADDIVPDDTNGTTDIFLRTLR
ncbi:PD40 domain-containing protein [Streptomyces clavuligerus]|uniref:WD40 domain-containing protein n=1 Tax=Streptomyces clavuligerus TaxID=1901 RepID=D5SM45_STRCL|nr:PD40 domain-containing protein [Streptomyces clavuligerus]EFG04988.1 WD40 domain-containing protein [Streptomyces clavuligerus]MBY6306588.1 PD40 domain-containing protein [Streptomyces clavuligerus]QCS10806.1 hypothetical protein CRV15_35435 [Streptomyces clavuligerus]QPJ97158.1 hypothetical protein GE265_29045 [Streptomyces clavuligerus]WDN57511.1 PD40 domain-containing protein [Streptomyces clavuligerus]